jgi:hypothetical protein
MRIVFRIVILVFLLISLPLLLFIFKRNGIIEFEYFVTRISASAPSFLDGGIANKNLTANEKGYFNPIAGESDYIIHGHTEKELKPTVIQTFPDGLHPTLAPPSSPNAALLDGVGNEYLCRNYFVTVNNYVRSKNYNANFDLRPLRRKIVLVACEGKTLITLRSKEDFVAFINYNKEKNYYNFYYNNDLGGKYIVKDGKVHMKIMSNVPINGSMVYTKKMPVLDFLATFGTPF